MQAPITEALDRWNRAWNKQLAAAQAAFTAAFPQLEIGEARRCVCLGPTMIWTAPGEGAGRVCLDDHGRALIEFDGVPTDVVGAVMLEHFGPNWFGEGPAGFAGADPGQYEYLCESTYAEYYFDLRPNSTTEIMISGAKIEDTVTVLDLLENALAERRETADQPLPNP